MIIAILILALAIPLGIYLTNVAQDELLAGRKWFMGLGIFSLILGAFFVYIKNYEVALTSGFILAVSFTSYVKSFDKKFLKRRI